MSYQGGGSTPGNGYWPGHDPPNAYNMHPSRLQPAQNAQYQAPSSTAQNEQLWNQNQHHQVQYGALPAYINNGYYAQTPAQPQPQYQQPQPQQPQYQESQQPQYQQSHQPQYQQPQRSQYQQPQQPQYQQPQQSQPHQPQPQQPQYISPAQLLQQQTPARLSQHLPPPPPVINGPGKQSAPYERSPTTALPSAEISKVELDKLLISLAEEFFDAAHKLAPSISLSMTAGNIEEYSHLIATGLGCLDTALKRVQLGPRVEANIRLRYAAVLYDETENYMEGETTLSKGIALCERQHYYDLKYAMQFLLAQFMARKSPKASMKAIEGHISEAQTYQHFSWVYVFRFLRASHALESPSLMDNHAAVQNLHAIASLAKQQGDHAIHLTASLMEAMAYMKTSGPETTQHVQTAIAAARSHQMEASTRIPQLIGLIHILDVASALRQANPAVMIAKLSEMQSMMDGALKGSSWDEKSEVIAIPIKRTAKSSDTVSQDTRMVLGVGHDGGDVLMMSFLNKRDAYSITYLLSGMVLLHKNSVDQKGLWYLKAGLDSLEGDNKWARLTSGLLPELVAKRQWRGQTLCYIRLYMAFCWANIAEWKYVERYIDELKANIKAFQIPLTGPLGALMLYITGVYRQGVGDFEAALEIFQNERFALSPAKGSAMSSSYQVERDVALLAALNKLWILQDRHQHDPITATACISRLEPYCKNHPNRDIQTAFNLMMATVTMIPPQPGVMVKRHLGLALAGAKATANAQFLCITLNVMCSRFFSGVVGDQAEKSAMAATVQASRFNNPMWKGVANGMLAQCYDVQGKKGEAKNALDQAVMFSQQAVCDP